MQKTSLFQSFLQKQKQLRQKIYERECLKDRSNFAHFQAVSHVNVINHQNAKSHLNLLQKQYLQCLKDYSHSQQSFKEVEQKLHFIQRQVVNQQYKHAEHLQQIKKKLYQLDLQNEVMKVKSQQSLQKIFQIKEGTKKLQNILVQHQKISEQTQQEVQYEKCMNKEILNRNNQLFQCLEMKSFQISQATQSIQNLNQTSIRLEQRITYQKSKIFQAQKSIQKLDNTLNNQTFAIESLLSQQNDRINDIVYYKQVQQNIHQKISLKKQDILQAEQVQDQLLKIQESLVFENRRCNMEIQVQEKGIDQQFWKIQKQKEMLKQNLLMIERLHQYLQRLAEQNQMLETILEKQIIQDHTIKLIVDSKCDQPVGNKTKVVLNSIKNDEKNQVHHQDNLKLNSTKTAGIKSTTMISTSASWNNANKSSQKQNQELRALRMRNQILMQKNGKNPSERLKEEFYQTGNTRLSGTGFSFINRLKYFE